MIKSFGALYQGQIGKERLHAFAQNVMPHFDGVSS